MLYRPIFKKIEYYLYNYDYLDTKIENIEFDINNSEYNQNYTRWIKNKSSSLEDQVIYNINTERKIARLLKWKKIIGKVLNKYLKDDILKYEYIELKYFSKNTPSVIKKKINLTIKEQKDIQNQVLEYIFLIATKNQLLKRGWRDF